MAAWSSSQTRPDDRPAPGNTCPSARCEKDAALFGIVGHDGVVGFITPPIRIDQDFTEAAHHGPPPEGRFRFAQQCVEGHCQQWTGSRCGLIDQVLLSPEGATLLERSSRSNGALPRCAIRRTCRWFAQAGTKACAVCPFVVHTPLAATKPFTS